jgi:hypothetical protein
MIACLIAVADGMEQEALEAVRGCTLRRPAHPYVLNHLFIESKGSQLNLMMHPVATGVDLGARSAGKDGLWDLWQMLPDSTDWTVLTRAQRLLAAAAPFSPEMLQGPWSPADFAAKFPEVASKHLYEREDGAAKEGAPLQLPMVVSGYDAATVARVDYRPTAKEIADDTEPQEAVLFAAAVEVKP